MVILTPPYSNAKQLCRITSKLRALYGTKLYTAITLTRRQTAQLVRLQTGHISFNQSLDRCGHAESPMCECSNRAIENVENFLIYCPRYNRQRAKLVKKVSVDGMWIEKLLKGPRMIRHTYDICCELGKWVLQVP
jgi:hypothetical protein